MNLEQRKADRACDVLVVSAFPPEIESLEPELGHGLAGVVGGLRVRARTSGVGLVASALGTARLLDEHSPLRVVFVGTCGAYTGDGRARTIGDVVVSRRIVLVDVGMVLSASEHPGAMNASLDAEGALANSLLFGGATPVVVGTTLGVTVDDALAARIRASTGADVEHLEAFAVAAACAARGLPFAAVLGVANAVGSKGRAEWRAHHRMASAAACAHVVNWARTGALTAAPSGDGEVVP